MRCPFVVAVIGHYLWKPQFFLRPSSSWLGYKVQLTPSNPIPRTHLLSLCLQHIVPIWPESPVTYPFRIFLPRKSLKRTQERQLGVLLSTFLSVMSSFQNKFFMEQKKIKLGSCKTAGEMSYLAHFSSRVMMGCYTSALQTKEPRTPTHSVTLGQTQKSFLQLTHKRLTFVDMTEFSHFFSFS